MSECADFWRGEFGDCYTRRNRVDWRARIPFWSYILNKTQARSVFEFGCNAGWNLSAIQRVDALTGVYGIDANLRAIVQARMAGLSEAVRSDNLALWGGAASCDLTFTAGVLIHIPPADLQQTMRRLVDLSSDWVLAVEYYDEVGVEVEYRGHAGRLWKRPYGKLYQDMGLELVETGEAKGFDQCKFWLLRKPA